MIAMISVAGSLTVALVSFALIKPVHAYMALERMLEPPERPSPSDGHPKLATAPRRHRWAVEQIERAASERQDISQLRSSKKYFARFDRAMEITSARLGRAPQMVHDRAELQLDALLGGLSASGFDWLVKCRLQALTHEILKAAHSSYPEKSRMARTAQRRVCLAVRFLPAEKRERYRQEWEGEMAGMTPLNASQFALNALKRAPKSGVTLRLQRFLGRQAA